jgi:probable rRNA maturation factor
MILNRQRTVRVARPPLEKFLSRVRGELGFEEADVTICLVSDAEIARMNEAFRKKKGPTDVLSFPAVEQRHPAKPARERRTDTSARTTSGRARLPVADREFLGDIAISPATARRNAKRHGRTFPDELQILVLHGVLHLLGYDHESDRGQMNRVERKLRQRLGLT